MKKLSIFIAVFGVMIGLLSSSALATSASFSTTRSASTITVGSNVTFSVRVNSGTNSMNTAEARLNFDSSKLQYVTHSSGAFTQVVQSVGSSTFDYAGAIFGSSVSGNQLLYSVTFKSIATGTASVTLSGFGAANAGTALSITSASGSSVSIQAPATSSPPPSSSTPSTPSSSPTSSPTSSSPTSSPTQSTNQEVEEQDTTPPSLQGEPEFQVTKSTITARLKSDEASKVTIKYSLEADDSVKQAESTENSQEHEILIGRDEPLRAGRTYTLRITLTDEAGNVSEEKSYKVKTEGVEYTVRIVDKNGQPLSNYPVTLFSDPIESVTDDNGVATFSDVTPGEHTVVFEIDGVTIRQPVMVGEQLALLASTSDAVDEIELPFGVTVPEPQSSSRSITDIALALSLGVLLTIIIERVWRFGWHKKILSKLKNLKASNSTADKP